VPSAIDVSSVVGLIAVGVFTAQILLGLLLSVGYNPLRQWPRQRIKIFTFHNWLGYIGLATAATHALMLLIAKDKSGAALFRVFDLLVPIWSPIQPFTNTLGAIAFYLVAIVVLTSYFRRLYAHHTWKALHYTAYAAAAVFFVHGILSDPNLKNAPVDLIDAEKVYVEGCALLIAVASALRIRWRAGVRRQLRRLPQ
jgi:predicted ferric reductase